MQKERDNTDDNQDKDERTLELREKDTQQSLLMFLWKSIFSILLLQRFGLRASETEMSGHMLKCKAVHGMRPAVIEMSGEWSTSVKCNHYICRRLYNAMPIAHERSCMAEKEVTRHYVPVEAGHPAYTINRLCEELEGQHVEGQIFMEFVIFNGLYKSGESVPEESKEALVRLPLSTMNPEHVATTMNELYQLGKDDDRVYPGRFGYRIVFDAKELQAAS
jgi:hypothetical protein